MDPGITAHSSSANFLVQCIPTTDKN